MADTKQVSVAVASDDADAEEQIRCFVGLGAGIAKDVRRRWPLYVDDWKVGMSVGVHIFAPATYIFFASVLPALAFGEQFRDETLGLFSIPHILCATAIAGVLQSVFGGQPLLIVGVAEPIVLVYYYIFKYCESTDAIGVELFRPFCAWVLILTALMHFILALVNASEYIHAFTRFSGETFGTLIALLFFQAAVKGLKQRVRRAARRAHRVQDGQRRVVRVPRAFPRAPRRVPHGRAVLARRNANVTELRRRLRRDHRGGDHHGRLLRRLRAFRRVVVHPDQSGVRADLRQNRHGHVEKPPVRSGTSRARRWASRSCPRSSSPCCSSSTTTSPRSSRRTEDFGLKKPPAYHYDFMLQGVNTLLLGLLGLPPTNGVCRRRPCTRDR
jgi:hypothetical protein